MTIRAKRILLVEDSDNDVELTLAALEKNRIANGVDVARETAALGTIDGAR